MMAGSDFQFRFVDGPVEGDWARVAVLGPDAGCVVEFRGTVRDQARGQAVLRLEYQAYPEMVAAELARIAGEMQIRHSVLRIAVIHSTGVVPVGQCSVSLAIASAHRATAFAATGDFMDELKARVPIWKHEYYADGSKWIGQGS
jgi:molybdopterin synthase catalytic subunit